MRTRLSSLRRAFTLVEILVSLGILGIIGLAFVRLVTSQARFTEGQMALRNARTVSRNSMNIMLTDLRMVQDFGGLQAAARNAITVRVPVAFGLLCANAGGAATMALLPVDSAMTALGQYSGWAYRDSTTGRYIYNHAGSATTFNALVDGNEAICTNNAVLAGVAGPGISKLEVNGRVGRIVTVTDPPVAAAPNAGWPVFLYQEITYQFDSSIAYPHRVGLFRKLRANTVSGFITDEIIAPFDTSAKFRFYVQNADAAVADPPADFNTVRGLELNLTGSSPRAEQGKKAAVDGLVTGVFFKNRRDP